VNSFPPALRAFPFGVAALLRPQPFRGSVRGVDSGKTPPEIQLMGEDAPLSCLLNAELCRLAYFIYLFF